MLKFDEDSHTYSVNGKVLKSVTEVVKTFFPFDEDKIAGIVSRKTGFEVDYIKKQWESKRNIACSKGNFYHDAAEGYFYGKALPDDSYGAQIKQFFEDHSFLNKSDAELKVFSEELGIAGTIDLIMEKDDELYIFDWKTSKEIKMESDWFGLKPANKLMDCSYVHYSLQLSLYRFILEKYYGKKVVYTGLIHLNESGKYQLLQTTYLKKEIKEMLTHPSFLGSTKSPNGSKTENRA